MNGQILKVRKGIVFNGLDNNVYHVTKDEQIVIFTSLPEADIIDYILKILQERDSITIVNEVEDAPHDLFLFRVAAIFEDDLTLMNLGTLTWMDDIENLKDCSQVELNLTDLQFACFQTLTKLMNLIYEDNSKHEELTDKLEDISWQLYIDLMKAWLLV